LTDAEILALLQSNPEGGYRLLYGQYSNRVYNTALSYLQHATDAEDVTQEVFLEVFRSVGQFRGGSSISTWLYRITINKCLDYQRHKQRKKRFGILRSLFGAAGELQHDLPDFQHPGIALENQERATVLFKAIAQLGESQKTAFILVYVEELSQKEAAEVMEISVKALESLLQRAKGNLRITLKEFYRHEKDL
jgi:RNA polymerase sigma factor (sigma-70 family)